MKLEMNSLFFFSVEKMIGYLLLNFPSVHDTLENDWKERDWMYEYMRGKLVAVCPTYVVIEVAGIGYQVMIANPYRLQSQLEKEICIELQQVVREDSLTLYGFLTKDEKELFQKLISVSGIGPKSAISILANDDTNGFVRAVESSDITYLTKFPGVGKKTAQQIVLDLKGKFVLAEAEEIQVVAVTDEMTKHLEEAREALLGLGYSAKEITKIWKELEHSQTTTTQEALSLAFKLLMK